MQSTKYIAQNEKIIRENLSNQCHPYSKSYREGTRILRMKLIITDGIKRLIGQNYMSSIEIKTINRQQIKESTTKPRYETYINLKVVII